MSEDSTVSGDEFRVEVNLGSHDHGLDLGERIRSLDLDDDARARLGGRVIVTRDGEHLFLYSGSAATCEEAERVVRDLIAKESLEADIRSTRWHPVAQEWKDASEPLPESEEAVAVEERERAAHEADEDPGIKRAEFVTLGSYKPKFLRDLGL